jgi:gliding motility-associated-like protein
MIKWFIYSTFFLLSYCVTAQTVKFSADTTVACEGVEIFFTDESIADTSFNYWEWDFGDGTTSNDTNPSHIYDSAGLYSVRLKIRNNAVAFEKIKKDYIKVRETPVAGFIYVDSLFSASYSIYFAGDMHDDSLESTYLWDFGDNGSGEGQEYVHTFSSEGTYNVTMIMNSGKSCMDTISKNVTVSDQFEVPNVFTPNGDGKNDIFYVNTNGSVDYTITILNRWGQIVYRNTAKKIIWDGHSSAGLECVPGTYFYHIESASGMKYEGHLMLIRD